MKGAQTRGKSLPDPISKVPVLGTIVHAAGTFVTSPLSLTHAILSGERIDHALIADFKRNIGAVKEIAPYVQAVISFVPGVGTGISGAIGAATALASGKSITQAVLEAAKGALPGGPLAKSAFDVATAAASGKGISEIALAAIPIPDSQKDIVRQAAAVAHAIAKGQRVDKILLDRVNANISKLPGGIAQAVQVGVALGHGANLQKTLVKAAGSELLSRAPKMNIPGLKNIVSAAKGMTPSGIQQAMGAAQALKRGSPVLTRALDSAASQFQSGTHEHHGFMTAVDILRKTAGNKAAMGLARRSLPSLQAQHGFDIAIGTVSRAVSANPAGLARRAGSIFVPQISRPKGVISAFQPNLKAAIDTLKRDPTLATQHPLVLANKFGVSQQTVLQALKHVSTQRGLPWRSLTPTAANFVRKWSPYSSLVSLTHGSHNTSGLDESGTHYIVTKGDSPFSIAQKLTGNGGNWTQLKALNTDKKPSIDKNVWVGEVLNIPPSWQKPTNSVSPGPAASSQPTPARPSPGGVLQPIISAAPAILQAKGILAAWGKTDGVNQAGVPDYGSTAADLSTDFGPRDKLQLMAFQNWDNKVGNAGLQVDGKLGAQSLTALQQWAEHRATQAIPDAPVPVVSIPGQVTTLPEVVITASPPSSPSIPQASVPVAVAATPPITIPVPSSPAPALPPIAHPNAPATPSTVAANAPASGPKMAPALAGAAVGGVLFGLPGAIIGGIAGAAMA
jgi:LysM repeat protein